MTQSRLCQSPEAVFRVPARSMSAVQRFERSSRSYHRLERCLARPYALRLMSTELRQPNSTERCLWRRLTGVVAIYALILQGMLMGFAAAPAAAASDDGLPAFELCLHGPDGAPVAPADMPGQHGDAHCMFCFAGTQHYLGQGPLPSSLFGRVDLKSASLWWPADNRRVSVLSRYSIARPRGPPLSA
jgi:hypothetical protein